MNTTPAPTPFGCGHNIPPQRCHTMWFSACPHHFSTLVSDAMTAAIRPFDPDPFISLARHIMSDRLLTPAYYTWMAMVGRYAEPDASVHVSRVQGPPEMPDNLRPMVNLLGTSYRAAVGRDAENMEAALNVIADNGDAEATLSFIMSAAASATINATTNDECTARHVAAYLSLGSQLSGGWGAVVLPELVDMIVLNGSTALDISDDHAVLMRRLFGRDPGGRRAVPTATALVTRLLAQVLDENVTVIDDTLPGIVDVENATPANTPPEMMPSVWAIRSAKAYARAQTPGAASRSLMDTARLYGGDPVRFAIEVITAGTQLIAYTLDTAGSRG